MRQKLKIWLEHLEQGRFAPLVQFVKFGLVGVSNTAISYGVEMLCFYLLFARFSLPERLQIVLATALGFIAGTLNSFYWNRRYVFTGSKAQTSGTAGQVRTFLKMTACYALTGLLLAPALKMLIHEAGVAYWLASLSTLLLTVPLNFLLNKFWAFRS